MGPSCSAVILGGAGASPNTPGRQGWSNVGGSGGGSPVDDPAVPDGRGGCNRWTLGTVGREGAKDDPDGPGSADGCNRRPSVGDCLSVWDACAVPGICSGPCLSPLSSPGALSRSWEFWFPISISRSSLRPSRTSALLLRGSGASEGSGSSALTLFAQCTDLARTESWQNPKSVVECSMSG